MNKKPHRPNNTITFSQAVDGHKLAAEARHLSPHTLADYHNTYRKFAEFLDDDPLLSVIDPGQIEQFLAIQTVTAKTCLNYHTGLASLWTWAVKEGIVTENILHLVEPPDPEQRAVEPFSENDIRILLASLGTGRKYVRSGKAECSNTLPNQDRNRAIILLLLDTGMRATELCELTLNNLDLRNRTAKVFGKGRKERILPFSARTGQALWRYCTQGRKDADMGDPVFITKNSGDFGRDQLLKTLTRLGARAGVANCHPHRFRHTFAINYLRNGGDPWSLQMMLGHTSMDMVRRYIAIAQSDLVVNHRKASPVDKWKL